MTRKSVKVVQDEEAPEYRPLTPQQQQFITLLAAGMTITDAANEIGLSRRAVTYWLHIPDSTLRFEYERLCSEQSQALRARVSNIYELAFKALEELLSSSETPPGIRWQAVKMLFESRLQHVFHQVLPKDAPDLIEEEANKVRDKRHIEAYRADDINNIPS